MWKRISGKRIHRYKRGTLSGESIGKWERKKGEGGEYT
jgi:hypothetical protein